MGLVTRTAAGFDKGGPGGEAVGELLGKGTAQFAGFQRGLLQSVILGDPGFHVLKHRIGAGDSLRDRDDINMVIPFNRAGVRFIIPQTKCSLGESGVHDH